MPVAIVISISSDIGHELAVRFASDGWAVWGTFRERSRMSHVPSGVQIAPCDLRSHDSISNAISAYAKSGLAWDLLMVAAGTEEPIGTFWECDADTWDDNVRVNALGPLRLLRGLYPMRNATGRPCVVFFSGSGTNSPAPRYSAYCASKIFLIKMCELLDSESSDTSFVIIGPGIVRTKIHEQTLRAPERSGANYRRVMDFLNSTTIGTTHADIYDCVRWCVDAGKAVVGGRNLSLVYDEWRNGGGALMRALEKDSSLYKLRRFGNDLRVVDNEE